MFFASDNWAGVHPSIAAALSNCSSGFEPAYGSGVLDAKVAETFSQIFEREVAVFFVGTGTAANSLSLVSINRPGGIVFCHRESHVMEDECGAPEYFMGGSRLKAVDGALGRIDPAGLAQSIERLVPQSVHAGRPMAVTLTQATEVGTVYGLDDIDAIAAICRRNRLPLHMDGARFANALVSLQATPAEMTWKRGVDIISFGGTKNGCWCAEAVILFDPDRADDFAFIRKRGAQLFSKTRFIAAQFDAHFENSLWLETARHANAMAERLAEGLRGSRTVRLAWEPQANEVFAIMTGRTMNDLQENGAKFYDWPTPHGFGGGMTPDEKLCRFVTCFETTIGHVDDFLRLVS